MSIDFGINQAEMMLLDKGVSDYTTLGPTTDTAKVYGGIKTLNATRVRLGAIWSYIEPTKPSSDADRKWVDLDRAMIVAHQYGLRPHVTLGLVFPSWSPSVTDFGNHCRAVAARYGAAGMNLNPSYEIMNEVNNLANLNPATAANYVPYLKAAYTNIKAVAPEATVVSAGLEPINDGWVSVSPINFVKGMYASGAQGYFDALGNHPYSTDLNFNYIPPTPTGPFLQMDDDIYAVMAANGDAGKQIWWTEIGFGVPPVTQQQQHDYLAAQWQIYLTGKPHVGPVFIFNYRCSGTDTSNANNNFGICNYDYSHRLAYDFVATINPGASANLAGTGTLSGAVTHQGQLGGSGSLTATYTANIHLPASLAGSGVLTADLFGRPLAATGSVGTLTASAGMGVTGGLSGSGSLTATADPLRHVNPSLSGSGSLTGVAGRQNLFSYNFDGTGSTKPTSLFTDFGAGYSVSSSAAHNNPPSTGGYYLSGGIYNTDQASADHFAEVPTASGAYGGINVFGFILGASPGFPDRSNVPIVRSNAAGTQFVGAYGHWGGAGSSAIFTVDPSVNGGKPVVQQSTTGAWTSDADIMRLTADGNTYTLSNTHTGATVVTWVDNTGAYAGFNNRRTGFGLQHISSNGVNYNAPGVGHTWKGQDVRAAVVMPPAPISVSVTLAGSGVLSASALMSYVSAAALSGSGTLVGTLGGGVPAVLSGVGALNATVGQTVAASNLTSSGALTATAMASYQASAALAGSGALTATAMQRQNISYTFTGTTKPAGIVDAGQTGTSTVSGGVLTEGNFSTTPTPADNQTFNGVALYPTPVNTPLYSATITVGNNTSFYSADGVAIGFDSAGTNGLLFMMAFATGRAPTCQVITKVGSTFTTQHSDNSNTLNGLNNPVLKVTITFNGSHYVYTPYVNGSVVTAAIFTDTSNVLGTPGKYWGAAFQPYYAAFNGSQNKSNGVSAMSGADT